MKDETRNELRGYANTVSENCRELAKETERLACFVEDLLAYRDLYDTGIETMDERYQRRGGAYVLCEDGNQFVNGASGAVEVDDRIKRDLRLYEYAKPRLKDAFYRLRYCDEMWFFTTETLACGWVDYDYIGPTIPDRIDLTQIHPLRVTRLDWLAMVNPVNNPDRKGIWSPFPFIDLYSQWIFTYHYPLYVGGGFHGAFVPHANINPMLEDSICKGSEKMMAIHDDGTLIGMNAAAEKEFELETYKFRPWEEFRSWEDHAAKVTYVRNKLNLMKNRCEDFHWLADGIKWQDEFEMTILGKDYTIVRERVPEIRMNLVVLLDKG
jgi:hypothetical protein